MITRKALATLLREAAHAQGILLTPVHVPEQGGRLAYRIGEGTALYTPGEAADRLGVVWPVRGCTHNTMVEHDAPGFPWKCADCGYVYGKEDGAR